MTEFRETDIFSINDKGGFTEKYRHIVYSDELEETSDLIVNKAFNDTLELISDFPYTYDTVADMQADVDLQAGDICHTLGFHAPGDGGAAWYKVKANGVANGMNIIELDNGCIAEFQIVDNIVYLQQLGCIENSDIKNEFAIALTFGIKVNGFGKTFRISEPVNAVAIIDVENVVFDFNNECAGLFVRSDNSDYKSPLTILCEKVSFKDCEFKNSIDVNNQRLSYSAALPVYAKTVRINNCVFHDNICNGLMLYGENADAFKDVVIDKCIAYKNGEYDSVNQQQTKTAMGIGSYQDTNNYDPSIKITNCLCYENCNSGIGFHGLNNIQISNCKCYGNYEHGITVESTLSAVIENCISFNNSVRQIRLQGNWNASSTYCKNVIVSNCILYGERPFGIGGGCENVSIQSCIITRTTTGSVITLDPKEEWDNGISITNCNITIPQDEYPQPLPMFTYLNANELNVIAYNNIVNNVLTPIGGEVLNRGGSPEEPAQTFITGLPFFYGLRESYPSLGLTSLSQADNVYTTTTGGAYMYCDVPMANLRKYVAIFFIGEYTHLTDEATNGIRVQSRGQAVVDLSNRITTQTCNTENEKCMFGMILNVNDFSKYYPNNSTIRFRFIVSSKTGDSFKLDECILFS